MDMVRNNGFGGNYESDSNILNEYSPFVYTEAYKKLRTNFKFLSQTESIKKIIVTSSVPGEGKTTVAVNLALVLAEEGAKVLLLDCDFRKPSVQKYICNKETFEKGLVSWLMGEQTKAADVICRDTDRNISYIPTEKIPSNPAEVLGLKRMEELLEETEKQYDYIICDTPPVGVVTDAALLSRCFDGVLFVIRQNYAGKSEVHTAKQNLDRVHANIIGSILTQYDVSMDTERSGSYQYYSYDNYRK